MFALLIQELRKIWRPGVVVALIVAAIAYAVPYTQLEAGNLNAPGNIGNDDTVGLINEYGPVVNRESVAAMKADLPELRSALDAKIVADRQSKRFGVTDYDSFIKVRNDQSVASVGENSDDLTFAVDGTTDWDEYSERIADLPEFHAYESRAITVEDYERGTSKVDVTQRVAFALRMFPPRSGMSEAEENAYYAKLALPKTAAAQVDRLYAQRDNMGYLEKYTDAYETTMLMVFLMFVYSVVMSVVLTASLFVADRRRNMRQLQWSSRIGRRVTGVQLLAVGLSSLAVCVVMAAVFAGVWLPQVWPYLATPVFSTSVLPWFGGWNFAGYLLAVALLGTVMTVTFTLGVAWVTHWFDGLIRAMLVVVPLTALFLFCAIYAVLGEAFLMTNALSMHTGLPGCEVAVAVAMIAVVAAVWAVTLRRARRADLAR
ncbi:hypothetical protein KIH77_09120 [Bifidobacterium sp. 82T24]|uniref:ABC transporter permease n=1 Tax=Bifidobacterium saimiriisciurei TaxID=2661627 RepID=A0ABX0CB81_9BIFI|nr:MULTISPECIES: hypothetical protein [Bifidobacterium]MBW3088880.1 hypothetical protein [Bifidobacterium pluvialisilvae]NEG96268.1 hypothetical protein [Bifidobacterium sp. SMB2]NEH12359.1 hypothetical protein [Bifidobacterium saimiriisciurei]